MINVSVEINKPERCVKVTSSGHADSAPKGQDTICAAVSTLIYGISKEFSMIDSERLIRQVVHMEDGKVNIDLACADERIFRRILHNLAPFERSMEVLAQDHPQAITLRHSVR